MSKDGSSPSPITEPAPTVTPIRTQPPQIRTVTPQATYEKVISDGRVFMETLRQLHRSDGTKFMVPTIGGKPLNLHRLFSEVTSRGGLDNVIKDRKWRDVVSAFSFPATITNASFVLRKYYISLLRNYEQVYYLQNKGSSGTVSVSNPVSQLEPLHPQVGTTIASPAANSVSRSEPSQPQVSTTSAEDSSTTDQIPTGIPPLQEGSRVTGKIYGKFEYGYLVIANCGSYTMRGVLYHVPLVPSATQSSGSYHSQKSRKDPFHPRSNQSGYDYYFAEHYPKLKPWYSGRERAVRRHITYLWNKLTQDEKEVYHRAAAGGREMEN